MLSYFRKWSIALKRRRLGKERAKLLRYKSIEENVRGDAQHCHNCNAPLTGPFCHICGQRDDDLQRPIWTFFRELMDALFDTDSKIIKTIITLVLMPGGLSRGFNEGRRARFLPPFRLYVVLLFIFFSALGLADVLILDIHVQPKAERVVAREAAEAAREAAEAAREVGHEMRDLGKQLRRTTNEEQRQEILEEIEEVSVELDRQLAASGLGDEGKKLRLDMEGLRLELPLSIPGATSVSGVPSVPKLPSLMDAVEGVERDDKKGGAVLRGLLGTLAKRVAEADGDALPDLRAAQEHAREALNDPNKKLSALQRTSLESVLAIDADEIEAQISEGRSGDDPMFDSDEFPYDVDFSMFVKNKNEARQGIKQEDIDFVMNDPEVPELVKKATEGLAAALQSPREFNKLFNEWLPWAMVVLMPVFALILRISHWGKRRYYLNQLVFALHFHSFLFVMLTVFVLVLPSVGSEDAFSIFWVSSSVYLIIALKVGQNQGWIRAFLKAGFIWVSYFYIMMTTMTVIMFLGLSDSSIGDLYDLLEQEINFEMAEDDRVPTPPPLPEQ